MLSDAELDTALSDVERMGDTAVLYIKYFERLITQAKLANQLQAQLEKVRSDALEEAAKICDNEMGRVGKSSDYGNGAHACKRSIIEALRKP